MTDTRTLPHDHYTTALTETLTDLGLTPTDTWTSDAETAGSYRYLSATIILTPDTAGIDAARWPHGLLLRWEWHTGIEAADGEPARGPSWSWAKRARRGNSEPADLPVDGYANPVQIAAAVHELAATGAAVKPRPGRWAAAAGLDKACTAWAADETGIQLQEFAYLVEASPAGARLAEGVRVLPGGWSQRALAEELVREARHETPGVGACRVRCVLWPPVGADGGAPPVDAVVFEYGVPAA